MKKTALKRIVIAVLITMTMAMCTACAKVGICDNCGQRETLHKYIAQGGFGNAGDAGNVYWYCDDCIKQAKFFGY